MVLDHLVEETKVAPNFGNYQSLYLLVPPERIEPSTSSLPMKCSTTEPWRQTFRRKAILHICHIRAIRNFMKEAEKKKSLKKIKLSSVLKNNLKRRKKYGNPDSASFDDK